MKKYVVYGRTTVTITKEVWANSESEAYNKAFNQLSILTGYCGNGGYDKLVGVNGANESVAADGEIEYNHIEMIDDDPDYHECPECGEKLEESEDRSWYCDSCNMWFDNNGNEIDPPYEEE